jgi:adenylate kinase family enzyme
MSKAVIVGSPFSGKSTLCQLLCVRHPELDIREHDEEVKALNRGRWPASGAAAAEIWQQVIEAVKQKQPDIFLTAAIESHQLQIIKQLGYTIIQLTVDEPTLAARVVERKRDDPANNARYELEDNLTYQSAIRDQGLVDYEIETHAHDAEATYQKVVELLQV